MSYIKFAPHGQFSISVEGRILIVEGTGPGNREVIEKYQKDVLPLKQQLSLTGKPWGNVVVLHGQSLLVKEAEMMVSDITVKSIAMGLAYIAIVLDDVECINIVKNLWHQIYSRSGISFEFFTDYDKAMDWLQECLSEDESKSIGSNI